MSVITNLKETRESKGLTQKEVADALCISKDILSRYERGDQDPRLEIAIRLSIFLRFLWISYLNWNKISKESSAPLYAHISLSCFLVFLPNFLAS